MVSLLTGLGLRVLAADAPLSPIPFHPSTEKTHNLRIFPKQAKRPAQMLGEAKVWPMANAPIGDVVRVEPDERLDIPDFNALQTLVYQAIVDLLGGLLGETSGVLGRPTFDTSAAPTIGIGSAMFVGCKRVTGDLGRTQGYVVPYNPASPVQASFATLNLAAFTATLPYLWWARTQVDSDQATRRRWAGGTEATFTPNTRARTRVIFGATNNINTPPNPDHDWFVWGKVTSWAGVVPTIQTYSPWDLNSPASGLGPPNPYVGAYLQQVWGSQSGVKGGLAQVITVLGINILRLLDSDWVMNPFGDVVTPGTYGFGTLPPANSGAYQMNDRVEALEETVPKHTLRQRVLLTGRFVNATNNVTDFGGDLTNPNLYNVTCACVRDSTGVYIIDSGLATAFNSKDIQVSICDTTNPNSFVAWERVAGDLIYVRTYSSGGTLANRDFSFCITGTMPPADQEP